jgi:hypothetical protein
VPDKPSYFDKIPSALEQLSVLADEFLNRECVETLLEVKRRRAQQLMDLVGTKKLNGTAVVLRRDFITFLEAQGGSEYRKAEKERRRRLGELLTRMRDDHLKEPPLLVEPPSKQEIKRLARNGIEALPPNMVQPGRILIECQTAVEAIAWLKQIVIVLSADLDGFTGKFERRGAASSMGPEQKETKCANCC